MYNFYLNLSVFLSLSLYIYSYIYPQRSRAANPPSRSGVYHLIFNGLGTKNIGFLWSGHKILFLCWGQKVLIFYGCVFEGFVWEGRMDGGGDAARLGPPNPKIQISKENRKTVKHLGKEPPAPGSNVQPSC